MPRKRCLTLSSEKERKRAKLKRAPNRTLNGEKHLPTIKESCLICNEGLLNENMPQRKTNLSLRTRNARCVQARKRFTEGSSEQEGGKPCNCKEHTCDLELRMCHMEQLLERVLGQLMPNCSAMDTVVMEQSHTAPPVSLHEAAEHGDTIAVVRALVRGEDPNALDLSGDTALHCAARWGEALSVELLLASGASLDTQDACGATPLAIAVCHGHQSIVKILLAEGAQVELPDKDKRTPLMRAVFMRNTQMVVLLVKHGASVNAVDRNGESPLVTSARHCSMDILTVLICHSTIFMVQMVQAMNVAGCSAAFMILVQAAPMAATCSSKSSPLAHVAKEGWLHPVKTILNNCVKRQCHRDFHDKNIQRAITVAGTEDILRLLWKSAPVTTRWVAVSRAAAMRWTTLLKAIVSHWKNGLSSKTNNFPEIVVALRGVTTEEAVLWLMKAHPLAHLSVVGCRPIGCEIASCAAERGWHKILKALINNGVPLDSKWNGSSLLHSAASRGNTKCVQILVYRGASVEEKDGDGRTPLHCAAKAGHRYVVDVLLKKGANLTAKDSSGRMPYKVATTKDIRNLLRPRLMQLLRPRHTQ